MSSVRRRLALSQVVALLPAALVGLACLAALLWTAAVVAAARDHALADLSAVSEAIDRFREEVVALSRAREHGDDALRAVAEERSAAVHERLAGPGDPRLDLLVDDYERLAGLRGPAGDAAEADRAARHALRAMLDRRAELLGRLDRALGLAEAVGFGTAAGLVLLVALALGLGALVALRISRGLVRDLDVLERGTRALGAGELGHRIALPGGARDDELARLARAFNRMAARIEALDRARLDFFTNLSHDLKTPLTSLLEAVDLLDEGVAGPLTEDQRRLVRVARRSGARMRALVRRVLDLGRLRAAGPVLAPADPAAVVDDALRELALLAERRGVRLERAGDDAVPRVLADAAMLRQVVDNLLDNAIEHSPRGGRVVVEVRRRDDDVEVRVLDEGPGIPPELRERVWDRFVQGPGERTGTGLGLHICRRIVEAHGGEVFVGDAPGGGAAVGFRLPVAGGGET